jgi:hypothetical protein
VSDTLDDYAQAIRAGHRTGLEEAMKIALAHLDLDYASDQPHTCAKVIAAAIEAAIQAEALARP